MWKHLSQVLKLTVMALPFFGGIESGCLPVHAMDTKNIENLQQNFSTPKLQINGTDLQQEFDSLNGVNKAEISLESLLQEKLSPEFERIDLNDLPSHLFGIAFDTLSTKSSLTTFCFSLGDTDPDILQESALASLVQLLRKNSLETAYLVFGDNFTTDAARILGQLLAKEEITLKRLLLDIGEDATGEKTIALLDGLEDNHSLTQLHFSRLFPLPSEFGMLPLPYLNAAIGQQGIERLVTYLANHTNIQSYNLSSTVNSAIPRQILLKSLETIRNHASLQNIGLRVDHDDEEVDTALAAMVRENHKLEFLELTSQADGNTAKKLNLVNFAESLSLSGIKAFNHHGFRLSEDAFNVFVRGLIDYQSPIQSLQFGGQTLTADEIAVLADTLQLPHSQIEQLVLPFSTINEFFSGTATLIESIVLRSNFLKKLGFERIELDIEPIRKLPREEQVSAFYNAFFQKLCEQQQQETLDVVLRWWPPVMGRKKEVLLSSQTFNLMGETFYNIGAARYLPILFNTFWQEESVSPVLNAWKGIGYFKEGLAVEACKNFLEACAKDPKLINPVFFSDADVQSFLLNTFFDQVNPFVVKSDSYHYIGQTHYILGKYLEATEWYDKAFRHEDRIVASVEKKQFVMEAGQSYLKTGKLDQALEYFEYIIQQFPNADFLDHINLGITYLNQGRNVDALAQYEKAIEKNPHVPENTYFAAAQVAITLENWEKAADLYEKGLIKTLNHNLVAYANLGTAYFKLENWAKASHYFNKAILLQNSIAVRVYERAAYTNTRFWEAEGKSDPRRLELVAIYLANIVNTYQVPVADLAIQQLAAPLAEILEIPEIMEAMSRLGK